MFYKLYKNIHTYKLKMFKHIIICVCLLNLKNAFTHKYLYLNEKSNQYNSCSPVIFCQKEKCQLSSVKICK